MLKYYRKGFLSIIKSEFAGTPENNFDVSEFNEAKDKKEQEKMISENSDAIIKYLESLDKNSDKTITDLAGDKADIQHSEDPLLNRNFLSKILPLLGLQNYRLMTNEGISLEDITDKIRKFAGERNKIVTTAINAKSTLNSELPKKPLPEVIDNSIHPGDKDPRGVDKVESKKTIAREKLESVDVESFKGAKRIIAELLNTDTNWFFKEELGKEGSVPALIVMEQLEGIDDRVLLKQIKVLLKGKVAGDTADDMLKNFNKLDGDVQDEIKRNFTQKLGFNTRSGIDINTLLSGEKEKAGAEKTFSLDGLKNGVRGQVTELERKIDTEKNTDVRNKLISERNQLLAIDKELGNISEVDLGLLIKDGSLKSGGITLKVDTGIKYVDSVNVSIGTDGSSVNGGVNINVPLYKGDKWGVGATAGISSFGGNVGLGVEGTIIDGTKIEEFNKAINSNGSINLDGISFDKKLGAGVGGNVSFLGGVSFGGGLEVKREFKEPIDRVVEGFRQFLSKLNIDRPLTISELNTVIKSIKDTKTQKFIENAIKDLVTTSPNEKVNVKDALAKKFSGDLIHAMSEKGWAVKSVGAGVGFWNGAIIPGLLGRVSIFSEEQNEKDQTNVKFSENKEFGNITEMTDFLNKQKIKGLNFAPVGKDKIQITPENGANVLDKLNICADKTKLKELVGYDKASGVLTFSIDGIDLSKIYSLNDGEINRARFLSVGGASENDILDKKDLESLQKIPTRNLESVKETETPYNEKINDGLERNPVVDSFIKENLSQFRLVRPANQHNYIGFNGALDALDFETSRKYLIEVLNNKKDNNNFKNTKGLINNLNSLTGPELGKALAQMKVAFMLDVNMFDALNKQQDGFNPNKLSKAVSDRFKTGDFIRMFGESGTLDTNKYATYEKELINFLKNKGNNVKMVNEPNMISVVATYPLGVHYDNKGYEGFNVSPNQVGGSYYGMDLMPAGVATVLGGKRIEILDDKINRDVLIDKVSNSPYGEKIVDLINLKAGTDLNTKDLNSILKGNPVQGVSLDSKFYAFLNGFCANESLGMEINGLKVVKQGKEISYSMKISKGVPVIGESLGELSLGTGVGVEIKDEPKVTPPITKPQEPDDDNATGGTGTVITGGSNNPVITVGGGGSTGGGLTTGGGSR